MIPVDPTKISGRFPGFTRPAFTGEFATDFAHNTKVSVGRSKLRYLWHQLCDKTDLDLNLDEGFDRFQAKPGEDERLTGLLNYLMAVSEKGVRLRKVLHDADFLSWRGTLTRIACSPFESTSSDGWRVVCTVVDGVVLVCELSSEDKQKRSESRSEKEQHFTYWGHKFEQYITTDYLDVPPTTTDAVSTWSNYSATFLINAECRDKKSNVRIFTGAEMDCVSCDGKFVELKTQFKHLGLGKMWYVKEMKWWLQSYLVGIETIVVGLRNEDGVVQSVKSVKVGDLGRRPQQWDPAVCLNFLIEFLDTVRTQLQRDGGVVEAEFIPRRRSYVIKKTEPEMRDLIVTKEFTEWFNLG